MKAYLDHYFEPVSFFDEGKKQKMIAYFVNLLSEKLMKSGFGRLCKPSEVLNELLTKSLSDKDVPIKGT